MKWSFIFIILMIAVISCVADNGINPFGGQQSGLSSQQAVPFDQQSISPAYQTTLFSQQPLPPAQQAVPFGQQPISSTQQQTKPFWYQNGLFKGFSEQSGAKNYYMVGVIKPYSFGSNLFKNLGATVQAFSMWKLLDLFGN